MNEEFRKICEQSETLGNISGEYLEYSEKELGVSFPKEYRDFLLEFGALLGNGFEIYGLIPEENQDEYNTPQKLDQKIVVNKIE